MIFRELDLAGVWLVLPEPHKDERGALARTFCRDEFAARGLPAAFEQSTISHNIRAGTLRGMHYQRDPLGEAKFVRCVRGAVFDVAIDLRPASATRGRWHGVELTADNGVGLFIPAGFAHGFQTLEPGSDVLYQITPPYRPGHEAGVRWNDRAFGIAWPLPKPFLSSRDASYEDWTP